MYLDKINLNHIRVFEVVYKTQSMTEAARQLNLTQSGISQHIKTLESHLGVALFDRISHRLVPTSDGQNLFDGSSQGLRSIERSLEQIQGRGDGLKGTINIGAPVEFGQNLVLPLVSKFSTANPGVRFRITLDFAHAMNEMLLSGELDIAFVDNLQLDKSISTNQVFEETLELYICRDQGEQWTAQPANLDSLNKLSFISYSRGAPVLRNWMFHHFGTSTSELDVRASVMDVQAVAGLIRDGMGAGVLPRHIFKKFPNLEGTIVPIKTGKEPLRNPIRMATLKNRTLSAAAEELASYLKSHL